MNKALEQLLGSEPALWRGEERYRQLPAIPTGFPELDRALPSGGWGLGGVTEILHAANGIGEFSLLLPALRQLAVEGHWCAFVAPPHLPYAPALLNAGLRLEKLLVVKPESDTDALWAGEQLLRSQLFAAVILWVDKTGAQQQRRLQLAAEAGSAWAAVYRPASARHHHSPVSLRILVGLEANALQLDIVKVRGGRNARVRIPRSAFDACQGVEWPIPAAARQAPRIHPLRRNAR